MRIDEKQPSYIPLGLESEIVFLNNFDGNGDTTRQASDDMKSVIIVTLLAILPNLKRT